MSSLKILNSSTMPNSDFKLSTVSKDTIEVSDGFNAQLSNVTKAYEGTIDALKAIKAQVTNDVNKNKKYLDSSRRSKFSNLVKGLGKQINGCTARKDSMKKMASSDSTKIKQAALKKAWSQAIDALLKEDGLSADTVAALNNVKSKL